MSDDIGAVTGGGMQPLHDHCRSSSSRCFGAAPCRIDPRTSAPV